MFSPLSLIPLSWRIGIGIALIVGSLGTAYTRGWIDRGKHDNVAGLHKQILELQFKIVTYDQIATTAQQRAIDAEAQNTLLSQQVQNYEDTIAKTPNPAFNLPAADADRLRELAIRASNPKRPVSSTFKRKPH